MKAIILLTFFLTSSYLGFSQDAPKHPKNSRDTVWLINSKSNTIYAGIDNYLEINKKVLPYKKIFIEIARGMVMEDENLFIVMVGRPGNAKMNIYQYDNGDTLICFSKVFSVKAVPSPFMSIDGQNIEKTGKITIQQLTSKKFEVLISDDFVNNESWYQIKSITVGYSYGKVYMTKNCDGACLSEEIINDLKKNALGKELAFIFTLKGAGDIFKRTDPIRLILY